MSNISDYGAWIMSKKYDKNSAKIKLITYIGNIISFISGILTILSFYGYKGTKQTTYIFIGIFLIILTAFLFVNKNKISKYFLAIILNKTIPDSNIMILDKIVVYEHSERYKYKFKSTFSIKVIGNEPISSHTEMLKWSAGFISNVQPVKNNQEIEYDKNPLSHNYIDKQKFTIQFPNGKKISKNDEPYKTGFKILELNDDKHIAKPVLVVGIYNITKNLTLKVYFNEHLNPLETRGLKYAHYIDEIPYDTISLKIKYDDEKNMHYVEFNIKNPIYGGKYAIDWNFNS